MSDRHWKNIPHGVFRSCMATVIMARIRPCGTSCGIESACLSYVTVSAVSISKRCTVNILNKISTPNIMSVLVFCRTMGAWPGGRAWRCRSFVPALWHVILAKLRYLTLLPIAMRTSNRCTQTTRRFTQAYLLSCFEASCYIL